MQTLSLYTPHPTPTTLPTTDKVRTEFTAQPLSPIHTKRFPNSKDSTDLTAIGAAKFVIETTSVIGVAGGTGGAAGGTAFLFEGAAISGDADLFFEAAATLGTAPGSEAFGGGAGMNYGTTVDLGEGLSIPGSISSTGQQERDGEN